MLHDARFRFFKTTLKNDEKKVAILFIIEGLVTLLLLANVIYLNINFFQTLQSAESNATTAINSPTPTPDTKDLLPTISPLPTLPSSPPTVVVQNPEVTNYFIPLGTGTSQASTWTDVPGAQATIDFGTYQNIKSIVLEASISVPTANQSVSVRLYNVSDNHPVWNSEMSMPGGASAYLISQPILYDTGSKIYQVQMQTQLQYPANLTQSRIHITLQ